PSDKNLALISIPGVTPLASTNRSVGAMLCKEHQKDHSKLVIDLEAHSNDTSLILLISKWLKKSR
ncbi:MAG: hypothetical protein MUE75_17905, partial [Algoriphagus sp.]|nr:hypothetical protein [Algoriphagus sp.]